jgi:hypothetical protein
VNSFDAAHFKLISLKLYRRGGSRSKVGSPSAMT